MADFGLSRFSEGEHLTTLGKLRGTYCYTAPEVRASLNTKLSLYFQVYFGKRYTTASDVYSLGVVLWELATKCVTMKYAAPYSEFDFIKYDFQIIIQVAKKDTRPTIPLNCPLVLTKLISMSPWRKLELISRNVMGW